MPTRSVTASSRAGGNAAEPSVRRREGRTKGDRREAQILDAARELLSTRALSAVTIDDLASAAGLSRTSFYFYFPTKNAVLAALLEQTWQEFGRTHHWFDTVGPAPEQLREQVTAVLELWRSHGPALSCALNGRGADDRYPPLEQFVVRTRRRFVDGLAGKIRRDRDAGLAPTTIAEGTLAELVFDLRETHMAHVNADPDLDAARVIDDTVEAILRLIYGRYDAPGPAND